MDGGDDADSLRAADIKGKLNDAVVALVAARVCLSPGEHAPVRPMLTGDGKAMLASNFREGGTREHPFSRQTFIVGDGHVGGSLEGSAAGYATALLPSGGTSCSRSPTFPPLTHFSGRMSQAPFR